MRPRLLRESGEFPPGSYTFKCPITGKQYNDTHTGLRERTAQVIKDRQANMRLIRDATRLGFDSVLQEISEQICERLGYNPKYCGVNGVPINAPPENKNIIRPGMTCLKCGSASLEEILCPTCGGRKVTGYKCKVCLHEMHR